MRHYLFVVFIFFVCSFQAQVNYPKGFFEPPVKIPLTLAGNFGEMRPNHVHAGFDIRTNGKEGLPVFAVADGYVSRIRISPVGYGKALYITHPNGFVSVYGHLSAFNTAIQAKTTSLQYLLRSFEIDTLINRELLPVKKGELIGFSGNSGSSQAPHLHFEIRDELTEHPINPYLFGFQVKDNVPPSIVSIMVYPIGSGASINGKRSIKKIIPLKINDNYTISKTDSLFVNGEIGFGINCFDKETGGSGTNNVFSIEMQLDGKRLFYYEMQRFSFNNARYVNAHIDYAEKQKGHQLVQKCFLSKNNLLEIYKDVQNNGIIDFKDSSEHRITFIIKDYMGNSATLSLKVKSTGENKLKPGYTSNILDCMKDNRFTLPGIHVLIPALALYDDQRLSLKELPKIAGGQSSVYSLGDETIPLQKDMVISIHAAAIPEKWRDKACLVSVRNGKFNYENSRYINDSIFAETKKLGKFAVVLDTLPPKIRATFKLIKTDSITDLRGVNVLGFKVTDNLSGIKKYRATMDGNWVLCEYDAKNDFLFYRFDAPFQPGIHQFKLEVQDDKENKAEFKLMFKK